MLLTGRRWTLQDRYNNPIYLTQERCQHIVDDLNHPEVADYEDYVKITIEK